MNRHSLAQALAKQTDLDLKEAEELIVAFGNVVSDALAKGEKIVYSNFGSFYRVHYPSKVIYHPVLGAKKKMVMLPTDAVKWMPSGNIKDMVATGKFLDSATSFGATKQFEAKKTSEGIVLNKSVEVDESYVTPREQKSDDEEIIIPIKVRRTTIIAEPVPSVTEPESVIDSIEEPIEISTPPRPKSDFWSSFFENKDKETKTAENAVARKIDTDKAKPETHDLVKEKAHEITYRELIADDISPDALALVSQTIARKHKLIPIELEGTNLIVGMTDPFDYDAIHIAEKLSRHKILPHLITADDLERALDLYQGVKYDAAKQVKKPAVISTARVFKNILNRAYREEATAVIFEPNANELVVKFKIDDRFCPRIPLAVDTAPKLLAHIQKLLGKDELPLAGYFFEEIEGKKHRFSVSALPVIGGAKIMIFYAGHKSRHELGLSSRELQKIISLGNEHRGIILTTSEKKPKCVFYALLEFLADPSRDIITLESEIDKRMGDISQCIIDGKRITYPIGFEMVLKQHPDILAIDNLDARHRKEIKKQAEKRLIIIETSSLEKAADWAESSSSHEVFILHEDKNGIREFRDIK